MIAIALRHERNSRRVQPRYVRRSEGLRLFGKYRLIIGLSSKDSVVDEFQLRPGSLQPVDLSRSRPDPEPRAFG